MKRLQMFFILFVVVLVSVYSAGKSEKTDATEKKKDRIAVMGVSGISGSSYPVMSVIAGYVENSTGSRVVVQASGGGTENIRLMKQGQYQMGYAEANVMVYGYEGINLFKDNSYKDMRFVANTYPLVFQAVVRKDSDIHTLYDLRGKGFSPGSAGSGDEAGWEEIFNAFGMKKSDLSWKPLTHTERVMAFKDRILASIGYETSCPSGSIIEAAATIPIRLLPIGGKEREKVFQLYPWYTPWTIEKNTYKGQDEEVQSIVVGAALMADANLNPDVVYDWLYAMYDVSLNEIRKIHAMSKYISLDNALDGRGPVPLHDGAIRYYKEKGLIK